MRLNKYIKEGDIIQISLNIEDPKIGTDYSEREIKNNIEKIEKAISKIGKPKDKAEEAILADLEDKLDKWKNVKKETKPTGPGTPELMMAPEAPPEEK